jgi:hypothetical protein
MHENARLLQRLHDGELTQAQAAIADAAVAKDAELQALSQRLGALDALMKVYSAHRHADETACCDALLNRLCQQLPTTVPKREVQVSVMHLVAATVLVCFVAVGVLLADQLEWILSDVVPMWSLAVLSMMCGIALLVAAKPLLQLENGMLNLLLRRRLAVGDGEVFVCRALGVALIVGGTHIAGVWG